MTYEAHGNFAGKHLVILGCGYVGGELARQALKRGVRVTALTRNSAKTEALRGLGANVVVADLAGDTWQGAIPRPDWVVNCVSSGGGGASSYRRSYLDGMKSAVAWASGVGGVDAFVYTSSTSVYPQGGGATVDETLPASGRDERSAVLVETEDLLLTATSAAQRRVVLRLAGIYGPDRSYLLEQVKSGAVSGVASHHLNLIHRDDACGAIWSALAAAPAGAGAYNVADDGRATKGEIVAWLAGKIGLPAPEFTGEPAGGRSPTPDRVIVNERLKFALGWQLRFATFREGYASLLSR